MKNETGTSAPATSPLPARTMTHRLSGFAALCCILLGLLFLLTAGTFAHRSLLGVDIMEARNLITAQEMIETGHWFLPTMHGELRLAKPPLPTWLTAGAMLLGSKGEDTDLAVNRIPSALAGLLLAVSLFGLTRFWTNDISAAAWSTAFLSTSYMFMLMTRRNSWDIYCHAFMLAGIWAMAVVLGSSRRRLGMAILSGILLGFSAMSKGPVSYYALLLPFIPAYSTTGGWTKIRSHVRDLGLIAGIALVLSLAWSGAVWLAVPGDFSRMLITEQSAWLTKHTKPFWFYLQFPLMTGIWSFVACAALLPGHARPHVERLLPYWRPTLWTLGSVGLLMLIPEKKDRYLLPVLVPLCQLMGTYLTGLLRDPEKGGRFGRLLIRTDTAIFALVCLGSPVAMWLLRARFPALNTWETVGIGVAGALGTLLLYRLYRSGDWLGLFLVKFSVLGLLILGIPALADPPSGDMSVPLRKIRAFASDRVVLRDDSLKFQDFWKIGLNPSKSNALAEEKLPENICFVSRKKNPALPDMLRSYVSRAHLAVADFSGHTLYLFALGKGSATNPGFPRGSKESDNASHD